MSAAGVWNMSPSLSLGLFMRGSEPFGPLGIDILRKSMAAEADIINLSRLPGRYCTTLLPHKRKLTL